MRGVSGIMMGAMACQKAAAPPAAGGFEGGEVIKEGASGPGTPVVGARDCPLAVALAMPTDAVD